MYLNREQDKSDKSEEVVTQISDNNLLGMLDLLKRDMRFWWWALRRGWYWLLVGACCGAVLLFLIRTLTTKKEYSSRSALVRQETEGKNSRLPSGIVPPQMNVVFNFFTSRKCLQETAERLNLNWSPGQVFQAISIKSASKNSNYLFLTAKTKDPELSAMIANTHAEVFLKHYMQLLQEAVTAPYESALRQQKIVKAEVDEDILRQKKLAEEYHLGLFERERDILETRIEAEEKYCQEDLRNIEALKIRLVEYQESLAATSETIELYSERNTSREQELTRLKIELASLQQRYTDANPVVRKKKAMIAEVEKTLGGEKADGQSKVVTGRNPEYTTLKTELSKLKASLPVLESNYEKRQKNLEKLLKRRDTLNRVAPEYANLETMILSKKSQLQKLDESIREMELFREREYSDFSIHELAVPNYTSLPRKRGVFTALGFLLGLLVSTGVVLGREAANLSIRSVADLEEALHLPSVGLVPLAGGGGSEYYSALQTIIVKVTELLTSQQNRRLIALAPPLLVEEYEQGMQEILSMVDVKDIQFLRIRNAGSGKVDSSLLINDYLYGIQADLPKPNRNNELFFKLDEMALIAPLSAERLNSLCDANQHRVVIWELFGYEEHPQLFSDICRSAALSVIPLCFGISSKLTVWKLLNQLRNGGTKNIYGVLYAINTKLYPGVNG